MNAPSSFLKKRFHLMMILFVTLFSFVFISVYKPFNSALWLGVDSLRHFKFTLAFYLVCLLFIALSRTLLYRQEGEKTISLRKAVLWLLAEYVVIAVLYILFTVFFDLRHPSITFSFVLQVIVCTALILAIPYFICLLYATILDCREEIQALKLRQSGLETEGEASMLSFKDRSGSVKLSADPDDIFYIDSQDNYVNIHYFLDGKMSTYLLRNSTSEVESALAQTPIVRCHRSYMVNLNHVRVLRHSKGKAFMLLDCDAAISVPVSRSYYKQLKELIAPEKIERSAKA